MLSTYHKYKDNRWVGNKTKEKIFGAYTIYRRAGVTMLIPGKVDFKTRIWP